MTAQFSDMANALRILSADMIEKAKSGHPGMPLGMADVATVLWAKYLRFDPSKPDWANRDRFVLSNGHGSALLYSLMYLTGFPDMTMDEIKSFRQWQSKTAGHPEKNLAEGIDFSTGPLGQGIASAVGMAVAECLSNERFGDELINHKTYVFVGDGCLMEGISEEAIELAGHLQLKHLIVLWDDNQITIDGSTAVASSTKMKERFEASGWRVLSCDGHDFESIDQALSAAQISDQPVLIDCATTIGYGAPTKAGTPKCHGSPLGETELSGLREKLGWSAEPFFVPEDVLSAWRMVGKRGEEERKAWEETLRQTSLNCRLSTQVDKVVSTQVMQKLATFKKKILNERPTVATRKASENVLNILTELPFLIGGSADLAAACYTKSATARVITAQDWSGNYLHYGIREHAMGAIMNGIAAYGGFLPFGGTFLAFADYMKPAIRMACLMNLQVWFILTHDSIGVGEDGPTHQPIEQLVSLRATPNLAVFRPCDSIETAESYECALARRDNPSAFVLSRQALPTLRENADENKTSRGAYILRDVNGVRDVTLIATGSEVSLAVEAARLLAVRGIRAAVVSMPCRELFEEQPLSYREEVLGSAPRVIIEAASTMGWDRFLGENGVIIGIDRFGASAPGARLMAEYGFTPENIENVVSELLSAS